MANNDIFNNYDCDICPGSGSVLDHMKEAGILRASKNINYD